MALVSALVFAAVHTFPTVAPGQDRDISAKEAYEKGDYATALGEWLRDAAAGDLGAQVNLGRLYALGHGVAKDEAVAISWFRRAADGGSAVAHHNLGVMYETGSHRDLAAAAKHYRVAAEAGRTEAQTALGKLYQHGRGVARDLEEAAKWFEEAAEDDDPEAQFLLGVFYANGWGVERDNIEMLYWTRRSARQGYPKALFHVGLAYDQGRGVDRNYAHAARFYDVAAGKGDVQAQARLGEMYFYGIGVDQSYESGFELLSKAAAAGEPRAAYVLGVANHTGLGVGRDPERGIAFFRDAASKGFVDAWVKLGDAYATGDGVPESQTEALNFYRRAADAGSATAELRVGIAYADGRGVDKDPAEAARWFLKSARGGNAEAQFRIAELYRNGIGVGRNDQAALRWVREAVRRGHPGAHQELAARLLTGNGVPRDSERAIGLLREAAENGSVAAGRRLADLFAQGWQVERDLARAARWYERMAQKGDARSALRLGDMYLSAAGGLPQDAERAAELYRDAANLGSAAAAVKLAEMHVAGRGVEKSHGEAAKWYGLAAEKGDGAAHVALGDFYRDARGVDRDTSAAERHYTAALAILEKTAGRDSSRISTVLRRLGELMRDLGRYEDAESHFRRAAANLGEAPDSRVAYIDTLIELAEVYRDQERLDMAGRTLSDALRSLRSSETPIAQSRLFRLGTQFERIGRFAPAADIYTDVLSRRRSAKGRDLHAWIGDGIVLAARGRALGKLGYDAHADADFVEALTRMERHKNAGFDFHHANALNDYGSYLLRNGHTGEAVAALEKAKELMKGIGLNFHPLGFPAIRDLAKGYERQGNRRAAMAELRASVSALAIRVRRLIRPASADGRAQSRQLLRQRREYVTLATAAPKSDRRVAQAFEVAQEIESAALSVGLRRMVARLARSDDALAGVMNARHRAIVARNGLETRLSGDDAGFGNLSRGGLRERVAELVAVERDLDRLETELAGNYPNIAPLLSLAPMTMAEAQRLLGGGEALITVLEGRRHAHVWVVTNRVSHYHRAALGADEIAEWVGRLRAALGPGRRGPGGADIPFPLEVSAKLYRELIDPARGALKGVTHVFFASQGALRKLPLSVLVTDLARTGEASVRKDAEGHLEEGHANAAADDVATSDPDSAPPPASEFAKYRDVLWFVDKYAHSTIPSVNTLRVLRSGENAGRAGRSGPDADISRRDRPKIIGDLHVTGLSAKSGTMVRTIAFAELPDLVGGVSKPDASTPVPTPPTVAGATGDRPLTASQIAGLKLSPDLVVLGADTEDRHAGAGNEDQVSEISRALFHAGARAVLVSNWPVERDVATAFRAALFAPRPGAETPSLAQRLQQATLDLLNDPARPARFAHPAYWGAFAIVGDGTRRY
jgi:TPR repeat protein/CHAT domain-containing protein